MWFKNLQVYRLPANWDMSVERLEEQLAKKPFHPCGSQDMESRGWLSPLGNEVLAHAVGGQWLVCLGFEHRLLPSAVVKQEADERAEELAEQQGFKLGRKQLKELREQVTQELMPRAFTRRRRVFAWIDPVGGWLVIDAELPDGTHVDPQTGEAPRFEALRAEWMYHGGFRGQFWGTYGSRLAGKRNSAYRPGLISWLRNTRLQRLHLPPGQQLRAITVWWIGDKSPDPRVGGEPVVDEKYIVVRWPKRAGDDDGQ